MEFPRVGIVGQERCNGLSPSDQILKRRSRVIRGVLVGWDGIDGMDQSRMFNSSGAIGVAPGGSLELKSPSCRG